MRNFNVFCVYFQKKRSKFKKVKKPILDNFILFLKINESHFLIKPNFCYAVQEKLNGYHGYWWISRKPHNFTKICGHHWIHVAFLIPEVYTFVHFCASLLSKEMHKKSHFLGLTPTLNQISRKGGSTLVWIEMYCSEIESGPIFIPRFPKVLIYFNTKNLDFRRQNKTQVCKLFQRCSEIFEKFTPKFMKRPMASLVTDLRKFWKVTTYQFYN